MFPLAGELFSFLAAIVFALSVVMFRWTGKHVPPVTLNLFKNLLVIVLLLLTILLVKSSRMTGATMHDYVILSVSGVLGIAIGDTFFFWSLNILGAGYKAIVDSVYMPMVVFFSFVILGERMAPLQIFGAAMILVGILIAFAGHQHEHLPRRTVLLGAAIGATSVTLMAFGIVIAKPVLDGSPVIWASLIRLVAGTLALLLYTLCLPDRWSRWKPYRTLPAWRLSVPAGILGGYIVMVLWIAGMKYTMASIASILNQLSLIFIIIFSAIFLKEPITRRKLAAIAIALAGGSLVALG